MVTTKATLETCQLAMQTINRDVRASEEAIAAAETVRDDRDADPITRLEARAELDGLYREKASQEIPQLKARTAYEQAKEAHRLDQWRTQHQPQITSAIGELDVALIAAVKANRKVAHALAEAHNSGNVVPIGGLEWSELLVQEDLRNRDSKYEVWRRSCQEYGFL